MLTNVMEDYLKAIYELQDADQELVSTSEIASQLSVKPPTVTTMTKKLAERGLVEREAYNGVRLTDEGETVAIEVIRHHRLLEAYLVEQLGYDWAEVHEEADVLEHHISETLEQRLAEALDETTVDPHGAPIPSETLALASRSDTYLSECEDGAHLVVVEVSDRDPEQLAYLDEAGITPGTNLVVTEIAPIDLITVQPQPDDTPVSLPMDVARTIRVRELNDEPEQAATNARGGA
ncbi:metal-dependent transcriptional regulator [Haloarcula rubra]|jgi:DtxR family Mn-dependent transcriptional regulator|nr:metal-dependent transcriptional regulator [Halomicroarcula rubra]